jgi:hypothetical protein
MIPISRFLQHKRTTELIRCHVPPTLPLLQRITLLKGLVKLQAALVSNNPLYIEIIYNESFWKFSLAGADAIHFSGESLWVRDDAKKTNVAFNVHYISEVFCTTEIKK